MKKGYGFKMHVIFILCAVVIAITTIYGIRHQSHHKSHTEDVTLLVTSPWKETVEIHNDYVAQIRSSQHIELRSFERGYLEKIFVDEGQYVRKGQKMFQLMPLILQAEVEQARAEYEITKIEYRNTKNGSGAMLGYRQKTLLSITY